MLMAVLIRNEGDFLGGESPLLTDPVSVNVDSDFVGGGKSLFPQLQVLGGYVILDFLCDVKLCPG